MSASALLPSAPTALVIVLGASTWPNSPGFQASEAFVHAAQGFRDYVLDPHGFGLPAANLLDQFDAQTSASDQLEMLDSFLEERTQALSAANQAVRDVLVYFVGHGSFVGSSHDFYLLPRRANARSLRASGMAIDALAEVLREKARQTRRYLFLDCCFAAAAFRAFHGGPDQTAITKTLDAFGVQAKSRGFPQKGTVLLCSSDQKSPSLLLPDESCTMFSYALLDVLRNGNLQRPLQLSLRDIKELAEDRLAALPEKNAPRPGLYSPDQSEGDVADVPFFPNLEGKDGKRAEGLSQQVHVLPSPGLPTTGQILIPSGGHKLHRNNISRRAVVTGLVGLAVVGISSGTAWFALSRHSTGSNSPQNAATVIPTPTSPPIPVGTIVTTYRGHAASVWNVAWSPDSRRIASVSQDSTVQIWWAALGSHMFTYIDHSSSSPPFDVAWSPDGKSIASASQTNVQRWDATLYATTSKPIQTYSNPSGSISCIAWSPDGSRIAVGDSNSTVQVFDAATGNTLQTYRNSFQYVTGLAWSPDSIYLASRASAQEINPVNGNVQVWNTSSGKLVFTSVDPRSDGGKIAWSPKGDKIAAGNFDPSPQPIVRILDATSGNLRLTYSNHTLGVNGLAWSPDGTYVASGSYDATVQIWNARNGTMVYRMNHSDSVFAVAWSPNGAFIASGGGGNNTVFDYTVRVWKAV
jgi:WD40 repeat protein